MKRPKKIVRIEESEVYTVVDMYGNWLGEATDAESLYAFLDRNNYEAESFDHLAQDF